MSKGRISDLINRQDAIEALVNKGQASTRYKLGEFWELNGQEIREALNAVPSAEPEIIRCKDCKYYGAVVGFVDDYCHKADWHTKRQLPDDFCSQGERRTE